MAGRDASRALHATAVPMRAAVAARRRRRMVYCGLVVLALVGCSAPSALAVPARVDVRIEGASETLFERPVLTEGHEIRAASEAQAHPCNGVTPSNPTPGPTPTAAAFDGMALIDGTFDARWESAYNDFFVTEWAGQRQAGAETWWVLVNNALLNVGGCQYKLSEGADVLWSYGTAPTKLLALYPQGSGAEGPPWTAAAQLNTPFGLEVLSHSSNGPAPAQPGKAGSAPYAGADIVPVQTAADGAEKPLSEQVLAVTDANGRAAITFTTPGWHRLKAIAPGTLRSNRIDVCVPPAGATTIGEPPLEDGGASCPPIGHQGEPLTGTGSGSGVLGSSETHSPGAGSGAPAGTGQAIRLGGKALPTWPADSRRFHYRGHWRRRHDPAAFDGRVMVGSAGATVAITLPAGRPVFAFDGVGALFVVEVRERGLRKVVTLHRSRREARPRLLTLARTGRAGAVTLRIVRGSASLDGVALAH